MKTKLFLGVDIGGTKTAVSLWEGEEKLLQKTRFATTGTPEEVIGKIAVAVGRMLPANPTGLGALGISCGGPLDSGAGLILSPPTFPAGTGCPLYGRWGKKPAFPVSWRTTPMPAPWRNGAGARAGE